MRVRAARAAQNERLAGLEADRRAPVARRGETEVYWGPAMQSAQGVPAELRFRRFAGGGVIVNQVSGGITPAALAEGRGPLRCSGDPLTVGGSGAV